MLEIVQHELFKAHECFHTFSTMKIMYIIEGGKVFNNNIQKFRGRVIGLKDTIGKWSIEFLEDKCFFFRKTP